jgi:hypothetical protein
MAHAFGFRKRAAGAAAPSQAAVAAITAATVRIDPRHSIAEDKDIDLVAGRHVYWPAADQGWRNSCVAFAVAACLELLRAGKSEAFEALSPQFLYWHMRQLRPDKPPPGWLEGATKLGQAKQVLEQKGICKLRTCLYKVVSIDSIEGDRPNAGAMDEAASYRVADIYYEDFPDPEKRPSGVARKVHHRLAMGCPVAIAVPIFAKTPTSAMTNWDNPDTERSGMVRDPRPDWVPSGAGHAVCVTGFQRDRHEPAGGWFIFRNSLGLDWGEDAVSVTGIPRLPHRGFGAISATYVEKYCWEMLSPGPA